MTDQEEVLRGATRYAETWKAEGAEVFGPEIILDLVERVRTGPAVTDEMVERGARGLFWSDFGRGWEDSPEDHSLYRERARAVLESALKREEIDLREQMAKTQAEFEERLEKRPCGCYRWDEDCPYYEKEKEEA